MFADRPQGPHHTIRAQPSTVSALRSCRCRPDLSPDELVILAGRPNLGIDTGKSKKSSRRWPRAGATRLGGRRFDGTSLARPAIKGTVSAWPSAGVRPVPVVNTQGLFTTTPPTPIRDRHRRREGEGSPNPTAAQKGPEKAQVASKPVGRAKERQRRRRLP